MAKVFEGEVSHSLHSIKELYCHKCPDHPHAIPDKVDFLACLPPAGRFLGLEAKEVRNKDSVAASIVTPNQLNALRSINDAGGIALVVVNFDRVRGVGGRVGFAVAYRWPIPLDTFYLSEGDLVSRVTGGWDLEGYLRSKGYLYLP